MTQLAASVKSRHEVETAAKEVYKFLKNEDSQLRKHMSHPWWRHLVANVYCTAVCAAVRDRKETEDPTLGISVEEFVHAIQARLFE